MPFTPYHLGPALLIGMLFFPYVDLVAISLGSIIIDIEPLTIILLGLGLPLHGPLHSFVAATIMAGVTTLLLHPLRNFTQTILFKFGLDYKPTTKRIFLSSLIGTYSHVLLDAPLYPEMRPFLPLQVNPFFGLLSYGAAVQICIFSGLAGVLIYIIRQLLASFGRSNPDLNSHKPS